MKIDNNEHHHLRITYAYALRGVAKISTYKSFSIENNIQDDTEQESKRLYFGDSWFGSVKSTAGIGQYGSYFCMNQDRALIFT